MAQVTTTPTTVAYRDEGLLAAGISASATTITVGAIYKNPDGIKTQQGFDSTAGYAEISYGDRYEVISFGAVSVNATTKITTLTDVRRGLPQTNTTANFIAGTGVQWPKGATIRVIDYSNYHHQTAFKDKANTFTEDQTIESGNKVKFGADGYVWTDDDGTNLKFKDDNNSEVTLSTLTAAAGTDEKTKVSSNDTTPDYLVNKITGGDGITVTETDDAGDETLDIDVDYGAGLTVSGGQLVPDTTAGMYFISGMIVPYAGSSAPTGFLSCDGSAVSRATYSALFSAVSTTYGTGDGSTTFNVPDLRGRFPVGVGTGTKVWTIVSVENGTDTITVPSNTSLLTGQAVVYTAASPATGLTSTTTYYVIRLTATTIKLASSRLNAVAGTVVNLTGDGSGTQTLTQTLTARTLADIGGEEEHSLGLTEIPDHTHSVAYASNTSSTGSGTHIRGSDGAANTTKATEATTSASQSHNTMPPFLSLNYIIKT